VARSAQRAFAGALRAGDDRRSAGTDTLLQARRFAQHRKQPAAGIEPAAGWQAARGELLRSST
jgi:hypothetical protein